MSNPLPFRPLPQMSARMFAPAAPAMVAPPPGMFAPVAAPRMVTYNPAQAQQTPPRVVTYNGVQSALPAPPDHPPAPHDEVHAAPTNTPSPVTSDMSLSSGGGGGGGESSGDSLLAPVSLDPQAAAEALGAAAAGVVLHVKSNLPLYAAGGAVLLGLAYYVMVVR